MWLTFLGDIACPHDLLPRIEGVGPVEADLTIVNLEGGLCPPQDMAAVFALKKKPYTLYNSDRVLPVLKNWGVRLASLANNHILDLGQPPSHTRRVLAEAGIASLGAGDDAAEAGAPAVLTQGDTKLAFLAFGWEVIECPPPGETSAGVNPLRPDHVLASIARLRQAQPDAPIIALMHWDYELEKYPMPAQRQLAIAMIDAGAAAVIGHHPHCAQGVEYHRGRPIAYSLGNWFLPEGDFFGQPVRFPDYARRQLAFRWRLDTHEAQCRWYDYDPADHVIRFVTEEVAASGELTRELTPFAGMPHEEYVKWFAAHRVKRKGLPIYRDYRHTRRNALRDTWLALRGWGVRKARG